MAVWWLSLENPPSATEAEGGGIMKGVSRRSNFMWSAWPSDQNPRIWSILLPTKWIGSMYLGVV